MSFDKLDLKDNNAREGRACLILCNIGGKELKAIKNYASLLGIRDMITVYSKNGDSVIKDVLENNIDDQCAEGRREKAIIFNAISPAKMSIFIENLRKLKINNILKATVTDTSINWTINDVLANLTAERIAISKGDFSGKHEK